MKVRIEYCAAWNYEPQAVSLADQLLKLKQRISSLELVPGSGGVFEVTADDKLVYSKRATGTFPEPNAVLQSIQRL